MRRLASTILAAAVATAPLCIAPSVLAQDAADALDEPFEGPAVIEIVFEGLERVDELYTRNQLRTVVGRPLDWGVVRGDLRRLERLGEFRGLSAQVEPIDGGRGGVIIIYVVDEAPIVRDVVVVGNREISDQDIAVVVGENIALISGTPIDDFRVKQASNAVEELYREAGYYQVNVEVDESELEQSGVVILRVREGERVRVTDIRFEGNVSFSARRIQGQVNVRKAGIFQKGAIDDEVVTRDVAAIRLFYENQGFLSARVSRRLTISPDGKEVIVTFLIEEGPQYTVRDIIVLESQSGLDEEDGGLTVMSPDQIRGLMPLKRGAVVEATLIDDSIEVVKDAYQQMGYVDVSVNGQTLRISEDSSEIDLLVSVLENDPERELVPDRVGRIIVIGNELTQSKVVRRLIDVEPDRVLNTSRFEETERNLQNSRIFDPRGTRITVQDEDPNRPGYRDILIEVRETNTGALSFGASVNSDSGLVGQIQLTQDNFDLFDTPDSVGELVRGRAFRGAGQRFDLLLAPGTEVSTYSFSLTEPSLFETDWSISFAGFFRERDFDNYDESRLGGRVGLGRAFGTRWRGEVLFAGQQIDIDDDNSDPLADIAEVEGESTLTSVGFQLTRTTVDNLFKPTSGSRTELGITQAGALGGDYTFTRIEAEHTVFLALIEDELGRTTTLRLNARAGWVPDGDELPIFERFYLGGRSFRGFDFRGIGPVGNRVSGDATEEKVGGSWSFFLGAQLQRPLFSDLIDFVVFVDSGTLTNDIGFDDYRVSIGAGVRLYLPQFGRAPLAFDFATPVIDQDTDEDQLFTFSIELPF
ncbi:MAG: outer membrane protein assembly factor BamA [Planctomycetota bacterium]